MSRNDWRHRAEDLMRRADCLPTAALKLGTEMADARAEEIAQSIEGAGWNPAVSAQLMMSECVRIARSTITKPKTREEVLEAALIDIMSCTHIAGAAVTATQMRDRAKHALDWKGGA